MDKDSKASEALKETKIEELTHEEKFIFLSAVTRKGGARNLEPPDIDLVMCIPENFRKL